MIWHCWLGDRKGIRPVKLGVGMLVMMIWLELCTSYTCTDLTTISIILCFNKLQNEDIPMPTYPDRPGKRQLNGCHLEY